MIKYLCLQSKRTLKLLPFVLLISAIIITGLLFVFTGIMDSDKNKEENMIFKVGIAGDTDNDYLKFGIAALKNLDESRFSVEFVEMEEDAAAKALTNGDISAYIVLPENFIENAINGNVESLTYVTTQGTEDLIVMFKNELTTLITDAVIGTQKGIYGLHDAFSYAEVYTNIYDRVNIMSIGYVELIIKRSEMLDIKELGISDSLGLAEYYICSITVLFLMLMGLPFISVHSRRDSSLHRMLILRRISAAKQLLCEWAVHFAALLLVLCVIFLPITVLIIKNGSFFIFTSVSKYLSFISSLLAVLLMFSAFDIFIFEISGNIISGVLIHFFTTVSLGYISGCFYPVYSLPTVLQKLQSVLPIGLSRELLASALTSKGNGAAPLLIAIYIIVFALSAIFIRRYKCSAEDGDRV